MEPGGTEVSTAKETLNLFEQGRCEDKWRRVAKNGNVDVSINEGFLNETQANQYLEAMSRLEFNQESIRIFGQVHAVPRLTASFGERGTGYRYSGIQSETQPFPRFLSKLCDEVQESTRCRFNFVLVNLYRNGQDKVGWHSDDEPDLGSQINVASLSLGAARRFKMRSKARHKHQFSMRLEHGSLLLMRHPTQLYWEHCVPQEKKVDNRRFNLTFRRVTPRVPQRWIQKS